MSKRDKYHVAVIVYNVTTNALVVGYRLRSSFMRGKWSTRIVALALLNAKVLAIVALEVVHCSIPSLGLRPKYNTFARECKR